MAITAERRLQLQSMYKGVTGKQDNLRRVEIIKASTTPINIYMPLKTSPYDHQKKAFAIATSLNASAMLMEMGTGKTLVAIAVAGHRFIQEQIKYLVIVAPLSVLPVWERQFKQHANFPYTIEILNDLSTKDKAWTINEIRKTPEKYLQVIVINYESIWRESVFKALEKLVKHHTMIILDESQKIKNRSTEAAKALRKLGAVCKYKMILTGTPVTQSPADFFSQYRFLDSEIFGEKWSDFERKYLVTDYYNYNEIVGYNSLDELAKKAHSIAFRCTKKECLDLPPMIDEILYSYLNESKEVYDTMEEDFVVSLGSNTIEAPVVLSQILRLQQITGGFLPIHDELNPSKIIEYKEIGTEKIEMLREVIEGLPKNEKVVIVCRFKPEIWAIEKMLCGMGKGVLVLSGDVPANERGKIVDTFQNDKGVDAIIINIQVGGSGIDLYAASTMIFYSIDYSYANYEQVKSRIHRVGQTADKVTYIHLITKDTIDEKILDAVQQKGDVAQLVVDTLKGRYE
jgi:SNF2 family DNA or RNA helicase